MDGINVNIRLANATFDDVEQFTDFLKGTGKVFERGYSSELTELDFVSSKNTRNVASFISRYSLPDEREIRIDGYNAETVNARVVKKNSAPAPKPEPTPVKYVVINIFLDKLGEDDARKIEYELRKFVGSVGEVQGDYQDTKFTVEVKFAQGSEGVKNVHDIEAFLKNDMRNRGVELLVDKPEGNSIKGSKPGGILDRVWW